MISQQFVPFGAALALALAPVGALAQETAPPATGAIQAPAMAEPGPAAAVCCTVPARTSVEVEIVDRVNSKLNRSRDVFAIRLAEPLVVDGRTVAPAGTPGMGEVVHAAKSGMAGKAGELILAARYLDLNGTRIALRSFRYGRSQGRDDTNEVMNGSIAAAALLPAASVIGLFIQGGEVDIPAGTRANAQTAAELVLAPAE
jgi:hypothetical protein